MIITGNQIQVQSDSFFNPIDDTFCILNQTKYILIIKWNLNLKS
jgi:hypothetical protein